jgi:hypothetical protein
MRKERLRPSDPIPHLEGVTLGDFWSWAFSDVVANTTRSTYAEFLVGSALGVVDGLRVEWDQADLCYRGALIEVKASAYVQSWEQKALSKIAFDIGLKFGWNEKTGISSETRQRCAHVYVFCVHQDRDRASVDVLDPLRWQFFVVGVAQLNEWWPRQKTVQLGVLEKKASPIPWTGLRKAVDGVLERCSWPSMAPSEG